MLKVFDDGKTNRVSSFYAFLTFSVSVAAMLHPAQGIVRRDRSYGLGDSRVESFSSTSLLAPQDSFDLGPAFFDGVEIGRIRGQIQQAGAGGLDFFLYGRCFVGAQVVQDHDLSRLQFRAQDLIEKSQKHI